MSRTVQAKLQNRKSVALHEINVHLLRVVEGDNKTGRQRFGWNENALPLLVRPKAGTARATRASASLPLPANTPVLSHHVSCESSFGSLSYCTAQLSDATNSVHCPFRNSAITPTGSPAYAANRIAPPPVSLCTYIRHKVMPYAKYTHEEINKGL